jgi:hypothetical protein
MTAATFLKHCLDQKRVRDLKLATPDASPTLPSAPTDIASYFQVRFELRRFAVSQLGISPVLSRNWSVAIVAMLRPRRSARHP